MKHKTGKRKTASWGLWIAMVILFYLTFKIFVSPEKRPADRVETVTLSHLDTAIVKYCDRYVCIEKAEVAKPSYTLERSFFEIEESKSSVVFWCVSDRVQADGEMLRNELFYVEPIFINKAVHIVLLKHVAK